MEQRSTITMAQVKQSLLSGLRFLGISFLAATGLFILVTLSQFVWPFPDSGAYSERMFWAAFASLIAGMPAVLAGLSTSQGYYNSPFTAGQDAKVAHTIIADGRRSMTGRTLYAWRMFTIGFFGLGYAALITLLWS
jgi:hypothetical protein